MSETSEILQRAISAAMEAQSTVPNYPPALLPVQVAQFILESDWGARHMGEANNYFGIKAREGEPFVNLPTWEFLGGKDVRVDAKFRKFDSMMSCFEAHANLICNRAWSDGSKLYARALQFPTDPLKFAHALTGLYATDPAYGAKLERIMRENDLLDLQDFSDVSDE